jgi:hypothetical protein
MLDSSHLHHCLGSGEKSLEFFIVETARSFASYRLKMHLTVEAIEEKPLIFLHSKRAIT